MSSVSDLMGTLGRQHAAARGRGASLARAAARPVAALVAGIVLIVALRAASMISGSNAALEEMGFDPDRARLITGLTVGGLGAGLGALLTGRRFGPMVAAYLGLAAVFGGTFLNETANALATRGPDGFRPLGWLATVVALAAAGLVTGWALAILAVEVRRRLLAGWALLAETRSSAARGSVHLDRGRWIRTLAPILAVVIVAGSIPTFADMINYTPDVAMTGGGFLQAPPLVGGAPTTTAPGSGAGGSGGKAPTTTASGGGTVASARGAAPRSSAAGSSLGIPPAGIVTPGAIASTQPWRMTIPTGQGQVVTFTLPSPWSGRSRGSTVWLYLPPGYGGRPQQRYPVIYTVPWDLTHWAMGIHVTALLDQAIDSGALPPSIVAFVNLAGGPFPTSECANSYDGREWADTYVSSIVVRYVDSHYRTVADPRARTIAGFSQGGFCAANLLLRHPGVFRQAVIFSGYFVAGLRSGETVNAWMPFGRKPALIAANSPLQTAGRLPPAVRDQLFVVLSSEPDAGVFGQQASQFANVLLSDGYPADFLWNQLGHAWRAVRLEFVPALRAVAEREVQTGALP